MAGDSPLHRLDGGADLPGGTAVDRTGASAASVRQGGRARPNVLLLMADQQKATSLRLYGNPDTRTPVIDSLAARGVWAEYCFVPHPFCFPSRCSLMTGRYPHAHGVRGNGGTLAAAEVPLAVLLQQAGYHTGAVGHFHGRRAGGERGFDVTQEINDGRQGKTYRLHHQMVEEAGRRTAHMTATVPLGPDEDVDGVMTSDAITFLESVPASTPFFLEVAWMAPHPPYFVPAPFDTMYDPAALAYPAQDEADAGKPPSHRQTARDMATLDAPEHELRQALAFYYGMVSLLDRQLERLLSCLERQGKLRDTIVIYTADHGDYAGEHGMWGKSCTLYDALGRVPLILAGPDGLLPAGKALDGLVQSIDVLPTLLPLLGLPVPVNVHGLPLQPLWGGSTGDEPALPAPGGRTGFDIAFSEVGAFPARMVRDAVRGNNIPFGPPASGRQEDISVMARTSEWKLVHTPGRDVQELYDLQNDPGERRNCAQDTGAATVMEALRRRALDWLLAHA